MDEREHAHPAIFFMQQNHQKHCHTQTQTLPMMSLMSVPPQSPHSFPAHVPVSPALDGHSCTWCPVLSVAQHCHHPQSFPLHNVSQSPFPPVHRSVLQERSGGRAPLRICGQVFHFCIPVMRRQNLRLPSSPRASPLFTYQLRASQARAEQAALPWQ